MVAVYLVCARLRSTHAFARFVPLLGLRHAAERAGDGRRTCSQERNLLPLLLWRGCRTTRRARCFAAAACLSHAVRAHHAFHPRRTRTRYPRTHLHRAAQHFAVTHTTTVARQLAGSAALR